jgi:hypothetical protein
MDTLDYFSGNSLTRFPFKDGATLVWTISGGDAGALPNTIVLDAAVSVVGTTIVQPTLQTIAYNGSVCVINFSNGFSFTIPNSGLIEDIISVVGNNTMSLTVDSAQCYSYFISLGANLYTFDNSCLLCVSCIKLLPPLVTEVSFLNTTQSPWTAVPSYAVVANISSGNVSVSEGTNLQFTDKQGNIIWDVLARKGQGLYDACTAKSSSIFTINNTTPNKQGNYFLDTSKCISTRASEHGLHINNSCGPACGPDSLISLAHYMNRITDGASQVYNSVVAGPYATYTELLASFSELTSDRPITLLAQATLQDGVYANITCGIYNQTGTAKTGKLTVSYPSTFTPVAKTTYFIQQNKKAVLPNPASGDVILNTTLPCTSVIYAGTVINLNDLTNYLDGVTFALTVNDLDTAAYTFASAGHVSGDYSYSIIRGTSHNIISISVMLTDPSKAVQSTSVTASVPSGFTTANNLITNGNVAVLSGLGFSGVDIDFAKSNTYELLLSCPNTTTGAKTVTISGTSTTGSFTHTINFTL